ncbi:AAA family ATPase [Nostocaceae cyanobacterium CENA369]|uniref:Circadian input-output histidine kinase CikA n=1 Tax=Dendronalium phyllosphericum CENA369 TaxID=1725256 RepID=A0A8J7LFS5_9NOST|nr:hybrid sensor histidine kinase/response regulator [Dendronalium phyllosphericum]MBH8575516.1 AAA family ATPase [Dendronalium phyllosphericum CENA369]
MLTLPGYIPTETLCEGTSSIIYRAIKQIDETSVIIKVLKAEYPTLEELTTLKHEYKILSSLIDIAGVINTLALEKHQNGLALVLEDFGAISLKNFIDLHKLSLKEFLIIAIQLAAALASIHELQIIHKDIKPQNIVINATNLTIKLIDFSIASQLSRENQTVSNPNLIEGTLAYMSPEQTGRMNRSVDYRTDFYSLGVTFYQMLTGLLPFDSKDSLEIIHSHIAKTPASPHEINSEIPLAVSEIVMKLLAKTAEDRYQNALGLKADLKLCLQQLENNGQITEFTIGQLDLSSQFIIPQKLYGREAEVNILLDAFERISNGKIEMMLVSGYSGIGKSSLVNEIHKPIVRQRGYFISGKFDQFKRNIPYASLIQAFQELMRQLLTESLESLENWKSKLLTALGHNGQIIIDVIPEVERIIGSQPAILQLGAIESQNRFNRVFQQFIHVFTKREHPLVLFLDDLQWADSASLKLIELIMTDSDSEYLLLIGAYRDNEVSATHPLVYTLEQIQIVRNTINNIVLRSLNIDCVNQLVADTLRSRSLTVKSLAKIVFHKTQGNPFFLTQLLKYLYQENFLVFNFLEGIWQWDIEQLKDINNTDNVVELMVSQIQKLSPETINVLKIAACIGDKFTLEVLATVNQTTQSETAADLWKALQAGLILPLNNSYKIPLVFAQEEIENGVDTIGRLINISQTITYKFLHDRVQQAAYSLIPNEQKKATHLKIGQLLLQNTTSEERKDKIFALVNQLNYGAELLTAESEKCELATLNLIAGQKAKVATAYDSSVKYLNFGIDLLTADSWESQYQLTLALYVETVAIEYLNTNFERASHLSSVVIKNAKNLLEKVPVYETQIQFYIAQNQMQAAIDTALDILNILEEPLPQMPEDPSILVQLLDPETILSGKSIEELVNLPQMSDSYKIAALRILVTVIPSVFVAAPHLCPLFIIKIVDLCVKYGNSPASAYGYALYGLILCGVSSNLESAYRLGKLSLKLLDKINAKEFKAKIYAVYNFFVRQWNEHSRNTIEPFQEGIQSALETGDIELACRGATFYCNSIFFMGEPLKKVAQEQNKYLAMIRKYNQKFDIDYTRIWIQGVDNLRGHLAKPELLIGVFFNEQTDLNILINTKNHMALFSYYILKSQLYYLFKNFKMSLEYAKLAFQYTHSLAGMIHIAQTNFYYSLNLLALYNQVEPKQQEEYLSQVSANQQEMERWADYAPVNFQHKYELVEAEKARILKQYEKAVDYYERAIIGANKQGYIQEEALANELAAEYHLSLSREKIAKIYMTDAYYSYMGWGAVAKVKDLEIRYRKLITISSNAQKLETNYQEFTQENSTIIKGTHNLDFMTVMKASQALSGEIVLSKLLAKLMQIVLENAGAQTGYLILKIDGTLLIEAQATVESDDAIVMQSKPVMTSQELPISVINYVARTQENVLCSQTICEGIFAKDPYIVERKPKSLLCTPLVHQGKLSGILYLENNLTTEAFTSDRLEVLKLLSSQAAISIENARLYSDLAAANATLEAKVQERTQELQEKNVHLQKAEATAQSANRAKSEFLANMSHELRTPLNGILGYAQILQRDKDLTSSQKNGINTIYQCGDHLLNLINEVLDLSKIEARKLELHLTEFHFTKFLEGIVEICQIRAQQKGISLIYQSTTNLPQGVRADEKRLRQVLINLLGNAVKFTEKGEVTLTVGYHNHQIRFQVEDTGVGMAPEQLQQIFLPFHQVGEKNRKVEGTGLGLSISRKLVQMMGGEIQVESTLGKGSIFFFDLELPEVEQSLEAVKAVTSNIIGYQGRKLRIIVADDKLENRLILVNMLAPFGFEVLEAVDGQDCLKKAVQWQPDCILMDLMMPTISGLEATQRLRRSPEIKDIIVIGTSASVFDFDRQKSQEVGCNDFLPKPVRISELLTKLQVYLKCEWIYDEESQKIANCQNIIEQSLIFPSNVEISSLLALASKGDIKGIIEEANRLENLNSQYIPFSQELYQLAKGFQVKKIREFLKSAGS